MHPSEDDTPMEISSRVIHGPSEGSGFMADETFFDDEDFEGQVEPITVNFECPYLTNGQPPEVSELAVLKLEKCM